MTNRCNIVHIPKRPGEFRTIYMPTPEYKAHLREITSKLEKKARQLDREGVAHGFVRRRSPVSMAQAHLGHAFTLSMDLKDFFDHVTPAALAGKLSKDELDLVIEDGAARQGLPTSPSVANIAFSACDQAILKFLKKASKNVVYTRYADDLAFSFDEPGLEAVLIPKVREIVSRAGFKVNERKTALQDARNGRRIVTGVAVDDAGVHPTREMKRRLRAAQHQGKVNQARGLAEWCKCKPPKAAQTRPDGCESDLSVEDEVRILAKAWRLGNVKIEAIPVRETVTLGNNVTISADPAMYLGMSTFTSGWTSCMSQPSGQFRKGVLSWLYLRGTRVAYIAKPGDNTTIHGITRPKMRARCLVHQLRDEAGTLVYDRIYGNDPAVTELRNELEAAGVISIADAGRTKRDVDVVGHIPKGARAPYFDNLRHRNAAAASGPWAGRNVTVAMI